MDISEGRVRDLAKERYVERAEIDLRSDDNLQLLETKIDLHLLAGSKIYN